MRQQTLDREIRIVGRVRTGRAADDASSSVSAKVAFVTDADKGLGAYVGITDGAAWRLPSAQDPERGWTERRTIFRRISHTNGRWLGT